MNLRVLSVLCSFAFFGAVRLCAVAVGDSYDSVIQEKGKPLGNVTVGEQLRLTYPDQVIKLKDGKVVAVSKREAAPKVPATPTRQQVGNPRAGAGQASEGLRLEWYVSLEVALKKAQAENKRVFMFFTGSDWCGWCMRLDREILHTPEFAQYAANNLVLLKLDFPRQLQQPEELKAQNAYLARQYRIEGFPTVVVLNGEGRTLMRLGYQEGGPGPFIAALNQ